MWKPVGKCWGKEVRAGKVVRECGGVGVVCIGLRSGREQAEGEGVVQAIGILIFNLT